MKKPDCVEQVEYSLCGSSELRIEKRVKLCAMKAAVQRDRQADHGHEDCPLHSETDRRLWCTGHHTLLERTADERNHLVESYHFVRRLSKVSLIDGAKKATLFTQLVV